MNASLLRVIASYRLLYLRGLMMDGQYRLPSAGDRPAGSSAVPSRTRRPRQRMLLAALTGLRHLHLFTRNKP
jgi:hypothetical protein